MSWVGALGHGLKRSVVLEPGCQELFPFPVVFSLEAYL